MKKIFYIVVFLIAVSFTANAQSNKVAEMKQKNNFMLRIKKNQRLKNSNKDFGIKINPFWQDVNTPHTNSSHITQVKVPTFNAVWTKVDYDSSAYDANSFLRSADGGKTWRLDSVDAPNGYGLSGISAY